MCSGERILFRATRCSLPIDSLYARELPGGHLRVSFGGLLLAGGRHAAVNTLTGRQVDRRDGLITSRKEGISHHYTLVPVLVTSDEPAMAMRGDRSWRATENMPPSSR